MCILPYLQLRGSASLGSSMARAPRLRRPTALAGLVIPSIIRHRPAVRTFAPSMRPRVMSLGASRELSVHRKPRVVRVIGLLQEMVNRSVKVRSRMTEYEGVPASMPVPLIGTEALAEPVVTGSLQTNDDGERFKIADRRRSRQGAVVVDQRSYDLGF